MKIHAYDGANLVPVAVPEICCLTFESNLKKMFLSTNFAMSAKSADGTFLFDLPSNFSYSALSPAWCGILGYNPTTSAATKNASSGILSRHLIFSKKSAVSFNVFLVQTFKKKLLLFSIR